MVAETVKSYSPYPALLPLAQQGINYSCTTSCSSALLPPGLGQAYSSPTRIDRNMQAMPRGNVSVSSSTVISPTPTGLGAGGMIPANNSAALLKDSIFAQRKQREFIPDNKKDDSYWDRRRRNNEAAKRSREKRRFNDMVLEQRVLELSKENHLLRAQVTAFENKFHFKGEDLVNEEHVLASMPQADQILALTRRPNLSILSMSSSPTGLRSPSSMPDSPPSANNSMLDDDQYPSVMSRYSSPHPPHLESGIPSSQQSHHRSHSPEFFQRDEPPQSQQSYSPESQNFYESTALNLSARSDRSPPNMDYCDDQINRSIDYSGSNLPHKLRHKTNQHGNHTASVLSNHLNSISSHYIRPQSVSPMLESHPTAIPQHYQDSSHLNHHHSSSDHRSTSPSTSPSSSHHMYPPVKREPLARDAGEESPVSSDDRDSGISLTSSPTLPGDVNYPTSSRDSSEDMDCNSAAAEHMRAELFRLAEEVRSLKDKMNRSMDTQKNISIGARR